MVTNRINTRELLLPILLALALGIGSFAVYQFTALSMRVTAIEANRYTVKDAKGDFEKVTEHFAEILARDQKIERAVIKAQAKLDRLPPSTIRENRQDIRELSKRVQAIEVRFESPYTVNPNRTQP